MALANDEDRLETVLRKTVERLARKTGVSAKVVVRARGGDTAGMTRGHTIKFSLERLKEDISSEGKRRKQNPYTIARELAAHEYAHVLGNRIDERDAKRHGPTFRQLEILTNPRGKMKWSDSANGAITQRQRRKK